MKLSLDRRAVELGLYIVEHGATVRQAAQVFDVSKSTVHKDVTDRLFYINRALYTQVQKVLNVNKNERHIRGGIATKNKYLKKKI
ncbi:MAG: sporulation transcriptional regulator SpoIIID [Bacillota bacterium]|nr:sporulation transcriptional regulator SpoIIID [Bacillota bacterium]